LSTITGTPGPSFIDARRRIPEGKKRISRGCPPACGLDGGNETPYRKAGRTHFCNKNSVKRRMSRRGKKILGAFRRNRRRKRESEAITYL